MKCGKRLHDPADAGDDAVPAAGGQPPGEHLEGAAAVRRAVGERRLQHRQLVPVGEQRRRGRIARQCPSAKPTTRAVAPSVRRGSDVGDWVRVEDRDPTLDCRRGEPADEPGSRRDPDRTRSAGAAAPAHPTPSRSTETETAADVPWVTIVWNDPVNLMSYVTYVFQKLLGHPRPKAESLMLDVHHKGTRHRVVGTAGEDGGRRGQAPGRRPVGHDGPRQLTRGPVPPAVRQVRRDVRGQPRPG